MKYNGFAQRGLSGAEAACSVHGSPSGWRTRVRFNGLARTEAGIHPAESSFRRITASRNHHPAESHPAANTD